MKKLLLDWVVASYAGRCRRHHQQARRAEVGRGGAAKVTGRPPQLPLLVLSVPVVAVHEVAGGGGGGGAGRGGEEEGEPAQQQSQSGSAHTSQHRGPRLKW